MAVAGSSLARMPAGGLPVEALDNGANWVVINEEATYVDERAEVGLRADVAQVLPAPAAAVGADDGAR